MIDEKSICEYVDKRYADLEKQLIIQIIELEKRFLVMLDSKALALNIASVALEKRLESMNEFRNQIKEERLLLLPRSEYVLQYERLLEDVRMLRESKATLEGKASQSSVNIAYIISAISIILGIVSLLTH